MPNKMLPRRSHTPIASLSPEERASLLRFNAYLVDLERFIVQEAEPLDRALLARKNDPADPLIDYDVEAQVTYTLRQDDPAFREDDDNILAERTEDLSGCSWRGPDQRCTFLNDGENHNDLPGLEAESHCWMYHDLTQHRYGQAPEGQPLDWPEVLRIGSVWLDLKATQQYEPAPPFGSDQPNVDHAAGS